MPSSSSAKTKKREVLSRDARIQAILEASQRVFAKYPYDEISIDDIALEASMSKGLLYHYFSSKRDLYLETLRSVLQMLSQIPEEAPDLHRTLDTFLTRFEEFPELVKMVFRGGIGSDAEAEALLQDHQQRQFSVFCRKVGGDTSNPLLHLALRSWISFFQEVYLQWLEHDEIPREQILALLEQSLLAIISNIDTQNRSSEQRLHEERYLLP